MSARRLRVSTGLTNVGAAAATAAAATSSSSQRPGTASAQLTARLRNRNGALHVSSSAPSLALGSPSPQQQGSSNQLSGQATSACDGSPLPPLDGWGGGQVPPRPNTSAGVFGRSTAGSPGGSERAGGTHTPPRSSPGLSRRNAGASDGIGVSSPASLYPPTVADSGGASSRLRSEAVGGDGDEGTRIPADPMEDGSEGVPLGLHKLGSDDLEIYVNMVRISLARKARQEQASAANGTLQAPKSTVSEIAVAAGDGDSSRTATQRGRGRVGGGKTGPRRGVGVGSNPTNGSSTSALDATKAAGARGGGQGKNRRRKHRSRSRHHHHHHHHHHHPQQQQQQQQQQRAKGGARGSMLGSGSSVASPSVNKGWGDASSASGGGGGNSVDGDRSWYARSKVSKTVPLRTLMLDSEVNNIPQVQTQSDFRALIKAQNIPHLSYDIDGDGIVSQEDYALAKRFDINGDGVLDEAEQVVGRRIMTEMFLERHRDDLHLYGQGLAQKSLAANVENISRSRGFKKIIGGLREKEKNFVNHGSDGVRECVTLKPKSMTRHNYFSNKFDTTAWNDFTRDPRDAGWLESKRHDGSRNQMYFMRKAEARENAQGKLNKSYGGAEFSTKRVALITNPAVENA